VPDLQLTKGGGVTTLEDDGELVFERGWIGVGVRSEALQLSPDHVGPLGRVKVGQPDFAAGDGAG
jgi:hypothetical protein